MFIYIIMFYMFLIIMMLFMIFLYLLFNKMVIFMEMTLVNYMSMKLELLLLLDWVSLLFISTVMFISLMVIYYSLEYMSGDLKMSQFIMLILMFVMSMLLMILSPNLISILIGWDGLGLVSYCLVIFYQSKKSYNSGMVTVLTNRLGDIMILISIGLFMSIGSWNFMFISLLNSKIMLMMMLVAFTKSAQVPFSSWLPLAMAAPTPVSSLVHSSTLVTAGVYLMIRMNYLILSDELLNFMMLVSVITMFLSGLGANFEFDLKKIIALSTLSQLGVMFFCLSMKLDYISLFHLLMHAMFKSMLFMCAGFIIHNSLGNQDIRFISMVMFNFPLVSLLFNCSTLSLCGIPFLSGFFSKDLILEMYLMNNFNKFILIILFISMGMTVMYSIRLISYSFIEAPKLMYYSKYSSFKSKMIISMYMLFLFSIIMGVMMSWILFNMKNKIYLTIKMKLMIYLFMFLGMLMGYLFMKIYLNFIYLFYLNKIFMFNMMLWFMPLLYTSWIFKINKFSSNFIFTFESGWLDYMLKNFFFDYMKNMFKLDFFNKNYMFMLIFMLMMMMMLMF